MNSAVSLGSLVCFSFTAYNFTVLVSLTAFLYIFSWFISEKAQVILLQDTSRTPDSLISTISFEIYVSLITCKTLTSVR